MQETMRLNATVLPGHRIEISAPEFPDGADVEILVTFPAHPHDSAFEQRFTALMSRWKQETGHLSSVSQISMNPAYQEIIGMGMTVVPFILRELVRDPDHWFWALRSITGADPVNVEQRGHVPEMAKAWLEWGEQQGYRV